ncbi:unnamed protein product [Clonostachys solani]|uniref:F-box domain-containing protein n=1 Tax=Clonostachys solani TaxID=160281 RepID=A0A9N9Z154_9HYPO|nr:unnamed protein product [Clonostachys solani]
MASLSPVESLPNELLIEVSQGLTRSDLIKLWKTSSKMSQRLNFALFSSTTTRQLSMRWACNHGDVAVIRAAISRGASPSLVDIYPSSIEEVDLVGGFDNSRMKGVRQSPCISTLAITAQKNHHGAFETLLELGADLEGAPKGTLKALSRILLKEEFRDFFRRLLASGLCRPILDKPDFAINLVEFIAQGAPVDILDGMITNGADPNFIVRDGKEDLASPLSQAIKRGSIQICELLLQRGAQIDGSIECYGLTKDLSSPFRYCRPEHLPIFSAASRMGSTGNIDMIDLCLRHGANINHIAPAIISPSHVCFGQFPMTPIARYLEAIPQWPVQHSLTPINGIEYFSKMGADIQLCEAQEDIEWPWMPRRQVCNIDTDVFSTVEVLLYKWDLKTMHEPQFFETIQYLVQQGGGMTNAKNLLKEFCEDSKRTSDPMIPTDPNHPNNVPQWWDIVNLIIDKVQNFYPNDLRWLPNVTYVGRYTDELLQSGNIDQALKDKLLRDYIIDRSGRPQNYGVLDRLLIDRIQTAGANINAYGVDKFEIPILHQLCQKWNETYTEAKRDTGFQEDWGCQMLRQKVKEFCLSMIQKGANPELVVNGLSAVDHLLMRLESNTATDERHRFLFELSQLMSDEYQQYLRGCITPNMLVHREDIRKYPRLPQVDDLWTPDPEKWHSGVRNATTRAGLWPR